MLRQIIKIDEDKCNGCGLCAEACHEGAISMIEGTAKLTREDYCDGLGNCLPACPTGAISFENREAPAFDEKATIEMHSEPEIKHEPEKLPCGCPGTQSKTIKRAEENKVCINESVVNVSQLRQWPVQIKLVPVNAPYFNNANLLIAADCTAYAHGNFHSFMKNKVTLIGCPKLDNTDYSDKLTEIIRNNNIKSITVIRMEVPCCGGIVHAVREALSGSGKIIPWQEITIATDGTIIEN